MQKLGDLFVLTDEQRKKLGLAVVVAIDALEPSGTPREREYALRDLYDCLKLIDKAEYQLRMKNHGRVE